MFCPFYRLIYSLLLSIPHAGSAVRSSYLWLCWLQFSTLQIRAHALLLHMKSLQQSLNVLTEKAMAPPLQYSCLENPMDGGAWWAAVHGVARVGHDWATSLSLLTFMPWRRKWQPTPVFLPGESQGRGSLVGCCLWGPTESDTTEAT